MIKYELAKQLKDMGFRQDINIGSFFYWEDTKELHQHDPENYIKPTSDYIKIPTLSELIESCGNNFVELIRKEELNSIIKIRWRANGIGDNDFIGVGKTPEEAVARLWLELKK